MIQNHSKKDEIYLANVAKIGNSINNIQYTENVLSQDEHKQILDFVKTRESWTIQPWDSKVIIFHEMPKEILNSLNKVFTLAYEKSKNFYDIKINFFEDLSLNLLKFEKDFYLKQHIDTESSESNHIASVYYINDDYTGGEINFPNYKLKIKPKPNSLIVFPGNENYLHEVVEITSGDRYSSSLWFQYTGSTFNKKSEWYDDPI
jgi:hypothetical protein